MRYLVLRLTSTLYTWQLLISLQITVREHRKLKHVLKLPVVEENHGDRKGTGHARQGSTRAPQWTGGGVVFAPVPRDYSFKMNKKEKRAALKSALTSRVEENKFIVVDSLTFDEIKTKNVANALKNLNVSKALVVLEDGNVNAELSAKNIAGVKTARTNTINVYDVMKYNTVIATKAAVKAIEEVYA